MLVVINYVEEMLDIDRTLLYTVYDVFYVSYS